MKASLEQFDSTKYEDSFDELCKLKQIGIVSGYQIQFKRLLARASNLIDKQYAECFINELEMGYNLTYKYKIFQIWV